VTLNQRWHNKQDWFIILNLSCVTLHDTLPDTVNDTVKKEGKREGVTEGGNWLEYKTPVTFSFEKRLDQGITYQRYDKILKKPRL
jgi:hypothetical protein